MINYKTERKILLKYSLASIFIVLAVVISFYYFKSNESLLILPLTGDTFQSTDWDWAHNLTYDPQTDEYCEQDACISRKNLAKEFNVQIETLDPNYDTSKIRAYEELITYLQTKDQSDCPFGYFDVTPEDVSHDKGDCVVRE